MVVQMCRCADKKDESYHTSLPFNVNYHQDHSLMAPKFDADP